MGNVCNAECLSDGQKVDNQLPPVRKSNSSVIDSDGVPKENAYRTFVKPPTSVGRQTLLVRRLEDADSIPEDIWLYDDKLNRKHPPGSKNFANIPGNLAYPYHRNRNTYEEVPRYRKDVSPFENTFLSTEDQLRPMRQTYQPSSTLYNSNKRPPHTFPDHASQQGDPNPLQYQTLGSFSVQQSALGSMHNSRHTPGNSEHKVQGNTAIGQGSKIRRTDSYNVNESQGGTVVNSINNTPNQPFVQITNQQSIQPQVNSSLSPIGNKTGNLPSYAVRY